MVTQQQLAASPEEVGVDPDRLARLFHAVESEVNTGGLPAAQVAVGRHGKVAGAASFGRALQGGHDQPVDNQTLFCLYSATKAVAGVGMWALLEDGKIRLDEKVADIVPEFAGGGKEAVTVEQVMLHTGGFPYAPMHPRLWEDRDARRERIKGWRLNWEPGTRFEYHATSAHWLLAEVMTVRTGLDFRDYLRGRLLDPMETKDLLVGVPDDQHARAADVVFVEPPAAMGGEINEETILHFNRPSQRRAGCPGGGGFSTAADLALFYQVLINGGRTAAGTQVLKPETIAAGTEVRTDPERHRDPLRDIPVNRGLTVVLAGGDGDAEARGFGRATSGRAFGHAGAGGQIAWADPESGISFVFLTNGFSGDERIRARTSELSTLAAACAA